MQQPCMPGMRLERGDGDAWLPPAGSQPACLSMATICLFFICCAAPSFLLHKKVNITLAKTGADRLQYMLPKDSSEVHITHCMSKTSQQTALGAKSPQSKPAVYSVQCNKGTWYSGICHHGFPGHEPSAPASDFQHHLHCLVLILHIHVSRQNTLVTLESHPLA
jgi:hypothetical protein